MAQKAMMSLIVGSLTLRALNFSTAATLSEENEEPAELRRAAEQGDAKAQFGLGLIYFLGEDVPQ